MEWYHIDVPPPLPGTSSWNKKKRKKEQPKKSFWNSDTISYKMSSAKSHSMKYPPQKPWDHMIKLTPDAQPINCKIYPLSPEEQKQLDKFLKENLQSGRVRPSKSPMESPFFFVMKKDRKLRLVQDYQKFNEITMKTCYPLPLIQELVDKLKDMKYFTKLDI